MTGSPIIKEIYIAHAAGAAMTRLQEVNAIESKGLEGDRYAESAGHYSNIDGWGAQVTLIQSEAIDAVNTGYETDFTGSMLRRNLITQGVELKLLVGREFSCGSAVLLGTKLFPPCMRLARLIQRRDVLRYFSHCGGVGASVVHGGTICSGDRLQLI